MKYNYWGYLTITGVYAPQENNEEETEKLYELL